MSRKPTPEEYRIGRENGISSKLMYWRMKQGWSFERAISEPIRKLPYFNKDREMAVYKGEELLAIGTLDELAEELKVEKETLKFYAAPAYHKRLNGRNAKNAKVAVWLDDDDED